MTSLYPLWLHVKLISCAPHECCVEALHASFYRHFISVLSLPEERERFSEDDDGSGNSCTIGSELYMDVSYLHYLYDARLSISGCIRACQVWSAPYDGEDPPPEKYQPGVLEEKNWQTQMAFKRVPPPPAPRPCPPPTTEPPSITQQELEWDDSYDACPVQTGQAPVEPTRPRSPPAEPPKHIQEMRKTAIMFVQGSYIEENEFQDDVMVYDLVAKKDSRDIESGSESEKTQPGSAEVPLKNSATAHKNPSDTKAKGQTDNAAAAEPGDDLLSQYEELIRTLDTKAGGEMKKPVAPAEEEDEEEEMDFASFSAETPEPEKLQSPFGSKFGSGGAARKQSVPFTGK